MKNIKLIALVLTAFLGGQSCTHLFDNYDNNPNQIGYGDAYPQNFIEMTLFSGAENLLHRTYLLNGELIQYTASGSSTNAYHRYSIPNGVITSAYNMLTRWAANANHIMELSEKVEDDNYYAVGLILKTYYMSNLTDIWGDVPYSEAFQLISEGVAKPKFDRQQDIYQELYRNLEVANSMFITSQTLTDPSRDLLYQGDVKKWQKFGNSLYLRLLMRLSNRVDDFWIMDEDGGYMSVSQKMQQIIDNPTLYPILESIDDNPVLYYTGDSQYQNMFGSYTESSWNSRKLAEFLVNLMQSVDDPRLSTYGVQKSGVWKGMESGMPATDTDDTGIAELRRQVLGEYTSPYAFMRYDELLFIMCEASFRGMITGPYTTEEYYVKAIDASLDYWNERETEEYFKYDPLTRSQLHEKLKFDGSLVQIMEQKYVAMFWMGYEAWHDYRRTELPNLPIGTGTQNDHILPRRFEYPVNSMSTNPVNYSEAVQRMSNSYVAGADDMKTPVWWSKAAIDNARQ